MKWQCPQCKCIKLKSYHGRMYHCKLGKDDISNCLVWYTKPVIQALMKVKVKPQNAYDQAIAYLYSTAYTSLVTNDAPCTRCKVKLPVDGDIWCKNCNQEMGCTPVGACDCGGKSANTTCSTWCTSYKQNK